MKRGHKVKFDIDLEPPPPPHPMIIFKKTPIKNNAPHGAQPPLKK